MTTKLSSNFHHPFFNYSLPLSTQFPCRSYLLPLGQQSPNLSGNVSSDFLINPTDPVAYSGPLVTQSNIYRSKESRQEDGSGVLEDTMSVTPQFETSSSMCQIYSLQLYESTDEVEDFESDLEENIIHNQHKEEIIKKLQDEDEELRYYPLDGYTFEEGDLVIGFEPENSSSNAMEVLQSFTMYKRVDKKVRPIAGTFPEEARVRRQIPHDPMKSLPKLPTHPPEFSPTNRLSIERMEELNVNKANFLWPEEEKLMKHILRTHEATLPYEEKDRGTLSQDYFSDYIMPVIPHVPWVYKNIPIPAGIRNEVIEVLRKKMEAGVYEHSQSSCRSRWFCVKKKSGALRMIHDLQPLNQVSIRDAGLMPKVDDFVEQYAGMICCTTFDMFWGFDGRRVHPQSRDMTAFYSPLGLLRLTCLPMGYTNAPAEFQNCMTFILQDEIPHRAGVFIDDLPVKAPKTWYPDKDGNPEVLKENPGIRRAIWEHAENVNIVMHKIRLAGATFSPKKTEICRPEAVIVGHKCSFQGRHPEDRRINKILDWPVPQNLTELRGFLGLCGTVRIWIKDYSHIARPLTQLQRKGIEYNWSDKCQEAFDALKVKVTTAPALRSIDYESDNPIILSVDTSYIAVGMVLSQLDENGKRRPARYGSIILKNEETRYSQPKLELYGLHRALREWRIYLIGCKKLQVEMDAKYVKGMLEQPDLMPNAPMNRWIQGIMLFDFELIHVPATRFKAPDGLSRRHPTPEEIEADGSDDYDDSWLDEIALLSVLESEVTEGRHILIESAVINDSDPAERKLQEINQALQTLTMPQRSMTRQQRSRFLAEIKHYTLRQNQLYKRYTNSNDKRVLLDKAQREQVLHQAHEQLGHRGEYSVYELVNKRFTWPRMRKDVHLHISSCHECQIRCLKKMQLPPTVSAPVTLFQKIYIDVMVMDPCRGYNFIAAAKDDLSGATEARPIRKNNAKTLARFIWEQVICRYGAVECAVTDNGAEVKGAFEILMRRMGIPQVRISGYNKHANGVVERGHFILREAIVKSCSKTPKGQVKDWPEQVPLAVFADQVTINKVTGYSPYYLLHGVDPVLPFDLMEATFLVRGYTPGMSTSDLLALRIQQLAKREADLAKAADTLKKARLASREEFMKRFFSRLIKENYRPGTLVLMRNTDERRSKSDPRYFGPYEVVRQTKGGSYILKEMDGTLFANTVAAFRIIPYITRPHSELQKLTESSDHNSNSPGFQSSEIQESEIDTD